MAGVNRPLTRRSGPKLSTLEVISLVSSEVPTTYVVLTAEQVHVNQRSTAELTLASPYTLTSSVSADPLNGVIQTLPKLTARAYGGGHVTVALPKLTLNASGTVSAVARVEGTLPALTLLANGMTGGRATANLTLGGYKLAAYGGAQATLGLAGHYSLVGGGTAGGVAVADLTLTGKYALLAGITPEASAQAVMTLPSLRTVPSGQAWLVGPRLSLHAVAHEVVAVSYEAYAINLTTGVVTHYTNYPFDNILRFGSKFYGVASTGLFEIGGALDVTTPIDAHIKTFSTKLGSGQMKRVPYVYSSGRSDGGVRVGITPDEGETYEYESDWGEKPGNTNHRTQIGKGVRGVYYSFDISNIDGSSLELDSITAEPAVSQRGI